MEIIGRTAVTNETLRSSNSFIVKTYFTYINAAETPISSETSHFYTVPLRGENCPEAASQIPPSNTNSFSNTENATLTH